MDRKIKHIIIFLLINIPAFGQHQNIRISGQLSSWEPEEPSIVINPSNTNEILIGSNGDNVFYSKDGGFIWSHEILRSSYTVNCDPCVLADNNNNFYFFHLVSDLSRVVCQKCTKLGGNWSNGTYTGKNGSKDNDKEWAAIDNKNNNIYVTWAQFDEHGSSNPDHYSVILLSRSTDLGKTWSQPIQISDKKGNARGGNYSAHAPKPAIGPNNEVYVTWMGPDGLMFDKSTDQAATWINADINITNRHVTWLTFNVPGVQLTPGFPVINCDISNGEYRGNIYISWAEQINEQNDTDIWLIKSTNNGMTWSEPRRVNNDISSKHQFFPWMTIDQTNGYIYLVFYDRRDHSDSQTDVFMALSKDGGNTFINRKISESHFTPGTATFLGDYIGISAHNNTVRPVWTRIDNGRLSLWTAIIDVNTFITGSNQQPHIPDNFSITSIRPNPFNSSTNIHYSIDEPGNVRIKIFNTLGQQIQILVDEYKIANTYIVNFNNRYLSSGIYIAVLQQNAKIAVKKMILLK